MRVGAAGRRRERGKLLAGMCALLLAGVLVGSGVYVLLGHRVIELAYHSERSVVIDYFMKGRPGVRLSSYFEHADRTVWNITFSLTAFLLIVMVVGRKPRQLVLVGGSLLVCSFLVFSVLELFPSLADSGYLGGIEYYRLNARFVADDVLVLRERPSRKRSYEFRGHAYSPHYRIEVVPKTVYWATDANGFRNSRPTVRSDIVVLGDSFIEYGFTEADMFPRRLERELPGSLVTNLGKSRYGPVQYLEVFKRYGIEQQPRIAIFGFFEGNDVRNTKVYLEWKERGTGVDARRYALLSSSSFVARYIAALKGTGALIREGLLELNDWGFRRAVGDVEATHEDIVVLEHGGTRRKALLFYGLDARPPDVLLRSKEVGKIREVFGEFKELCEKNNIVPIVMFIPTANHIYAEYSTPESGQGWLRRRARQVAAKRNVEIAIMKLAQELELELIDLSPVFEAAAKEGEVLYHALDSHWNSKGRALAAEYTAEVLKTRFTDFVGEAQS